MWQSSVFCFICLFTLSSGLTCHHGKHFQNCSPIQSCYHEVVFDNCKGTAAIRSSGCAFIPCAFVKSNGCFSYSTINRAFTYRFCCCNGSYCNGDVEALLRLKQGTNLSTTAESSISSEEILRRKERLPEEECSWFRVLISQITQIASYEKQ